MKIALEELFLYSIANYCLFRYIKHLFYSKKQISLFKNKKYLKYRILLLKF